jgi:hypothetical protein
LSIRNRSISSTLAKSIPWRIWISALHDDSRGPGSGDVFESPQRSILVKHHLELMDRRGKRPRAWRTRLARRIIHRAFNPIRHDFDSPFSRNRAGAS